MHLLDHGCNAGIPASRWELESPMNYTSSPVCRENECCGGSCPSQVPSPDHLEFPIWSFLFGSGNPAPHSPLVARGKIWQPYLGSVAHCEITLCIGGNASFLQYFIYSLAHCSCINTTLPLRKLYMGVINTWKC